jgi:hypothetical protein
MIGVDVGFLAGYHNSLREFGVDVIFAAIR